MCLLSAALAAQASLAGTTGFGFDAAGDDASDSLNPRIHWDFKSPAHEVLSARGFVISPKDPRAFRLDPDGFAELSNGALAAGETGVVTLGWPFGLPRPTGSLEAEVRLPAARTIVNAEIQLRRQSSVLARARIDRGRALEPGQSTLQTGAGRTELGMGTEGPHDFTQPALVRMEWSGARVRILVRGAGFAVETEGTYVLDNPADPDNVAFVLETVPGGPARRLHLLRFELSDEAPVPAPATPLSPAPPAEPPAPSPTPATEPAPAASPTSNGAHLSSAGSDPSVDGGRPPDWPTGPTLQGESETTSQLAPSPSAASPAPDLSSPVDSAPDDPPSAPAAASPTAAPTSPSESPAP